MEAKTSTRNLCVPLLAVLLLALASCHTSDEARMPCSTGQQCLKGDICVQGECMSGRTAETGTGGDAEEKDGGEGEVEDGALPPEGEEDAGEVEGDGALPAEGEGTEGEDVGEGEGEGGEPCPLGTEKCIGHEIHICLQDGVTKKIGECDSATQVCINAICATKECEPGGVGCETGAEISIVCNAYGTAIDSRAACASSEYCEESTGKCLAQKCMPGEKACEGGGYKECDSRGTAFGAVTDCAENQECREGTCISTTCTAGEKTCAGNQLLQCKTDNSGFEKEKDCGAAEYCDAGACKPMNCTPLAKRCVGDTIMQCDAQGKVETKLMDCTGGTPRCEPDSKSCVACLGDGDCGENVCNPQTYKCEDPCNGKECGTFSGKVCGTCTSGKTCNTVTGGCQTTCVPDCAGQCSGAPDGCGGTCTGDCPAGQVCDQRTCCTPKSCADMSSLCGDLIDGCGSNLNCDCALPAVCDGGRCCTPDCGGKNCGDNGCGGVCGTCSAPQTCGGAGEAGVCGTTCTPENDPTFCSRLGKNCGSVTANDNCGNSRTVGNCGACTSPQTCGGGGTQNVCGEPVWYDSASNLTWKINPAATTMKWQAAIDYCAGLGGGWRLPTIGELRSLIRGCAKTQTGGPCGVTDSCLSSTCNNSDCTGCSSGAGPDAGCYWPSQMEGTCYWYWSSSPVGGDPNNAWGMGFAMSYVSNAGRTGYDGHVRCARSGP